MLGSKIKKAPENDSSAVSFMYLKLRMESKEDYKARWGSDHRIANQIMWSLEGGQVWRGILAFQRCVNINAQEQWTGQA